MARILLFLFAFIIIFELSLSFLQYYSMNIDGDLALIVVPQENYLLVLKEPFGFNLIFEKQGYSATNRFFAHWQTYQYFRNMPVFLQNFTDAISSLYLSSAILKTILHIIFLYCISAIVSGSRSLLNFKFILAALIITPLFQANGQNSHMGLVHSSITYTIFYSFPVAIFCAAFLPLFLSYFNNTPVKNGGLYRVGLLFVCVYLCFNGPLGAPIFMIISALVFSRGLFMIYKEHNSRLNIRIFKVFILNLFKSESLLWVGFVIISVYSFYIGTFNNESKLEQISLLERFKLLPIGVFKEFTEKSGSFILLVSCLINSFLLFKYTNFFAKSRNKELVVLLVLFCLFYTVLLPIGGYRSYRPYIVRGDTYLPVIIVLIFFYGFSSVYLLNEIQTKLKMVFMFYLVLISAFYFYKDGLVVRNNKYEVAALKKLARTTANKVVIDHDCSVLSWSPIYNFEASKLNGEFLYLINITSTKKTYRSVQPSK